MVGQRFAAKGDGIENPLTLTHALSSHFCDAPFPHQNGYPMYRGRFPLSVVGSYVGIG